MLFKVTETFGCIDNIGYIISDNASAINTMVNYLEKQLQAADINWFAAASRVRYLGHIIHLSAHDFFFLKAIYRVAEDNDLNAPRHDDEDA